ncbi:Mut7-C ubiquitin/RNAse domain-containing protein [Anaeromyxobacter terrae]|uniref:Mut7-C ubiquitin/RNAse domain-containing protein n=1 Tax=Anaeromyxobacter terrae TaxID=2925406 RepID=UPI001F5A42C0|nr:Mut7-C ubiquitin/RNAse domain-containing protein [Anaeromyxobacter sp. SG22]
MRRALFRFYAELNDFLPPARKGVPFVHAFEGTPSVKDVIESLGVPHTEVDLVLADGEAVDFGWGLRDGARVSVYPVFESLDVASVTRVRAEPLRDTRFVADGHLGRLARYLRMAGFDVRWERDAKDDALARVASEERRILLTRDRGLLKRSAVSHGYCVREADPPRQLAEVIRRFDLGRAVAPFRRCLRCNALLEPVRKEDVQDLLPPRVRERYAVFRRCPECGRVYWPGSHHARMERILEDALRATRASG